MNSMSHDVDLLAVALVREYLSRKGYKTTLNQFDKESKKRDNSIQNRKVLAEELGIMEMVIKNKERGLDALKTFLEMFIFELLSVKSVSSKTNRIVTPGTSSRSSRSRSMSFEKINLNNSVETSSPQRKNMAPLKPLQKDVIDLDFIPAANKNDIAFNTSPSRLATLTLENEVDNSSPAAIARRKKLVHNMMMQDPGSSKRITSKKEPSLDYFSNYASKSLTNGSPSFIETVKKHKMNLTRQSSLLDTRENGNNSLDDKKSHESNGKSFNRKELKTSRTDNKIPTDLTMSANDVSSDDLFNSDVIDNYEDCLTFQSEDICLETAIKLKHLLFGCSTKSFNKEWTQQGFRFCQHPLLKYGLVQEKGGPCGLLASVQAVVLKHLLFMSTDRKSNKEALPQPNPIQQKAVLTNAFVDIFKAISLNKSEIIIALPSRSSKFAANREYRNDNLTEKLRLYHLHSDQDIKKFLTKNIFHFMNTNGCILFLYSVMLSYGIENIRNTMDETNGTLMGSHGYCTQEMVNMLLTGKPVSNVFDGVVELDSGGPNKVILHGIKEKNDIGFLSLYEHYQSCKVGDNYKDSNYPIWVVCSESHFSVLFSPDFVTELSSFDLYYYDGLGRQDEEIRLTVTLKSSKQKLPSSKDELIPPLEHCIRTKWSSAVVSWNGSDPLL